MSDQAYTVHERRGWKLTYDPAECELSLSQESRKGITVVAFNYAEIPDLCNALHSFYGREKRKPSGT